jgi:hypothetical protein
MFLKHSKIIKDTSILLHFNYTYPHNITSNSVEIIIGN